MSQDSFTHRLQLVPLNNDPALISDIFAIQSDPNTWQHLPGGCETDISQSAQLVADHEKSWSDYGLGWWAIVLREQIGSEPAGNVVGLGGCGIRDPRILTWNLGYRLSPSVWGRGLAQELSQAACNQAHLAERDIPISARVLSHNVASWKVLERVGLGIEWEGDTGSDVALTRGLKRRVYSDRQLGQRLLGQLIALG